MGSVSTRCRTATLGNTESTRCDECAIILHLRRVGFDNVQRHSLALLHHRRCLGLTLEERLLDHSEEVAARRF